MQHKDPAPAPALLWLRRELRLHDNRALAAAVASGRPVLPVFVLDDETPGTWAAGGASRWWLHHSLAALAADLGAIGAPLVLRRGRFEDEIARLVQETGAAEIHAGLPAEPWARKAVDAVARTTGADLHLHRTITLFEPDEIRTQAGGPYGVFTPFARACLARGLPEMPLPAPKRVRAPASPRSEKLEDLRLLPTKPDWAGGLRATWKPGESAAAARLRTFIGAALHGYHDQRNIPGADGTSMLSPYLHWGEISPAQIWHAVAGAADTQGQGPSAYVNELIWREFAAHLLWHHPELPQKELRAEFAQMPWRRNERALRAWQHGRTGVPIVDAGMRQLWHTGWMHNRVRMIVGSFLVKHLLIPWQDGEAWFWDTLVDADLATNSASWQWVAGCGADAAPFFRIFNPVLQGRKFDPDGAYVRRFVPELARLSDRHIHAPWDAPADALAQAWVELGRNYPLPIIDLADGRERALDAFKKVTRSAA